MNWIQKILYIQYRKYIDKQYVEWHECTELTADQKDALEKTLQSVKIGFHYKFTRFKEDYGVYGNKCKFDYIHNIQYFNSKRHYTTQMKAFYQWSDSFIEYAKLCVFDKRFSHPVLLKSADNMLLIQQDRIKEADDILTNILGKHFSNHCFPNIKTSASD